MSCKASLGLPQNAVLSTSDVAGLRGAANIFFNTPAPGSQGRRFTSAAAYVQYKKAAALAGSVQSDKLPPQTSIITQLQTAGCS